MLTGKSGRSGLWIHIPLSLKHLFLGVENQSSLLRPTLSGWIKNIIIEATVTYAPIYFFINATTYLLREFSNNQTKFLKIVELFVSPAIGFPATFTGCATYLQEILKSSRNISYSSWSSSSMSMLAAPPTTQRTHTKACNRFLKLC